MLTMSPLTSGRESGMPWQMHSFTDVHTLFGKLPARARRRPRKRNGTRVAEAPGAQRTAGRSALSRSPAHETVAAQAAWQHCGM
jgi:hypothetical protein